MKAFCNTLIISASLWGASLWGIEYAIPKKFSDALHNYIQKKYQYIVTSEQPCYLNEWDYFQISLKSQDLISPKDATVILEDLAQFITNTINNQKNKKIRPLIKDYPFRKKNLAIRIFTHTGYYPKEGDILCHEYQDGKFSTIVVDENSDFLPILESEFHNVELLPCANNVSFPEYKMLGVALQEIIEEFQKAKICSHRNPDELFLNSLNTGSLSKLPDRSNGDYFFLTKFSNLLTSSPYVGFEIVNILNLSKEEAKNKAFQAFHFLSNRCKKHFEIKKLFPKFDPTQNLKLRFQYLDFNENGTSLKKNDVIELELFKNKITYKISDLDMMNFHYEEEVIENQ